MRYIFTADWHLREDVPRCRKQSPEEWAAQQIAKVNEIVDITNKNDAVLVIVGDIFHRYRVSEFILNGLIAALFRLDNHCLIMRGNHDMKYRDTAMEHTAFGTLVAVSDEDGVIRKAEYEASVLPYGLHGKENIHGFVDDPFLLIHQLCFPTAKDIPVVVQGATSADELMDIYDNYDLIVCGDGHNPFHRGAVINCGSIFQQSINETHEPSVWLYDNSKVTRILLEKDLTPIVKDVYAEAVAEREERFTAFVELLQGMDSGPLSWDETVEEVMTRANASDEVKGLVREIMEVSRGR